MADDGNSGISHDWDLLFMIRVSEISKVLAANKLCDTLQVAKKGPLDVYGSAVFDSWQMLESMPNEDRNPGNTASVAFQFDLSTVTIQGGPKERAGAVTIPKVTFYASLTLQFVRQVEDSPAADGSVTHKLVFAPAPQDDETTVFGAPAIDLDGLKAQGLEIYATDLKLFFKAWLAQNLGTVQHAFAVIDVFDSTSANLTWLKPTAVDYTYSQSITPGKSSLCVLAMTGGTPPDHSRDISLPDAFLEDGNAAIHINTSLFVGKAVLNGLPKLGLGGDASQFAYTEATATAALVGTLPLAALDYNGRSCPRRVDSITAMCVGDALKLDVSSSADLSEEVLIPDLNSHHEIVPHKTLTEIKQLGTAFVSQTSYLGLKMQLDQTGKSALSFTELIGRGDTKKWFTPAPQSTEDIIFSVLDSLQMATLLLLPGIGEIAFAVDLGITTGMKVQSEKDLDKAADDATLVPLAGFISATSLSWNGFSTLDVIGGRIENGLKLIAKAKLA